MEQLLDCFDKINLLCANMGSIAERKALDNIFPYQSVCTINIAELRALDNIYPYKSVCTINISNV